MSTRCAHHPNVVAVDTCVRCGAFVCGDCLELMGEEPYCHDCFNRREVTGSASVRAILALLFASTGLICGAPFGVVGLILAWQERKAIARGEAPLASRSFANVARALGWASVILTVLAGGAFIVFVYAVSKLPPPPSATP